MKKISKKLVALLTVSAIALSGCSSNNTSGDVKNTRKSGEKIKVYTSFYPMYDFAKKIGGDKIEVKNLVPAGTEPHDWEPSPQDLAKIGESDVFIYSGAGMEAWADKVSDNVKNNKLVQVEASKGISLLKSEEDHDHDHDDAKDKDDHEKGDKDHNDHEKDEDKHEHDYGEYDPHVWLNPQNAKIEMKNIKDAFIKADPKNKAYYEENFKMNSEKMDKLDNKFKTELSKTQKKDIIVSHEAFGYLANAYGLKQIGIEGLSPDSEPDASRMAEITKFAKENNVKYIFFEELVSPKVSKTIAKEVGAQTEVLNPLEGLTKDQLDKGEDYFSIMENNLNVLLKALK
ncbi:metal ABC transporter substrate-binding protein [Peptostreptococcus equinus]|uniref:Metal ABC transporter substrate-binding protein n=1 Tax=Peptostreptococcus equinus TaxID=3003601 RepID=A0ABY7JQV5_9FIRM|nr:metal ABC transporter substrate-binding protein [Peptostreptococcus sp. CBA3647]WAW14879.1 metal ABC transporter substrate-binding protein [Peptostreptococcus sp. CBA3647]